MRALRPKQGGVDTSDADAVAGDILNTKTAYVNDLKVTGDMANNGDVSEVLDTATTSYTVPAGYHGGAGTVSLTIEEKSATPSATEQEITPTEGKVLSKVTVAGDADLTAGNIKKDVAVFGVTGTYEGVDLSSRYNYYDEPALSLDLADNLTVSVSTEVSVST